MVAIGRFMNLRDLRYLLAVAEHEHFGRAARACGVSQPTLSVQIRKLEDLMGVTLFERSSKTAASTEACLRLLGHARAAVSAAEAILATARNMRDPLSGRFRPGIIPTLAPHSLPLVCAAAPGPAGAGAGTGRPDLGPAGAAARPRTGRRLLATDEDGPDLACRCSPSRSWPPCPRAPAGRTVGD